MKSSLKRGLFAFNYIFFHRYYHYPAIYIAALPKTASTWFSNLLVDLLPGYMTYYPSQQVEGQIHSNYDVTDEVVKELRRKLVVVRSHTPATVENVKRMNAVLERYLVLTRDMRDVIVSVYYHIHKNPMSSFIDYGLKRTLPWKPVPVSVLEMDKEACMDMLINKLLPDLVAFSQHWLDYSAKHDNILMIRYEDLIEDTIQTVSKVFEFYNVTRSNFEIQCSVSKMKQMAARQKAHNFRKGKVYGWKEELNLNQQKRCEEITGPFLTQMGYERLY